MRIGIVGWYGYENAGDERILYCLKRFFVNHELIVIRGFRQVEENLETLNHCDQVLIGGGGLILRNFGIYANIIDQIKTRLGCIGISVEVIDRSNNDLVEILKEKAEFILVRDQRSSSLFKSEKVLTAPDLTFLYPYDVKPEIAKDICGINLRQWPRWKIEEMIRVPNIIYSLRQRLSFIDQVYPFMKWDPKRIIKIVLEKFEEVKPIPLLTTTKRKGDIHLLNQSFSNVPQEFKDSLYSECKYFIGMRLHSQIFACQMGIPFISLSYQPKNEEFSKSVGMENYCVSIYKSGELPQMIEGLKANNNELRNHLIDVRDKNTRQIHQHMSEIEKYIF